MDSPLASVLLPAALAVVMLGLGLSLTVADFARVGRQPRVVAIALVCQLLLLPAAAFGLVLLFDLSPVLAVGMMLLAASPGGTMANLFSHLFRGDVALNVSLTAINSVIAVVSVPLVTGLAIDHFSPAETGDDIGLQFGKIAQVFAIVLIPVVVGMTVRARRAAFAARMDRPVRITSVVVLVGVILGTAVAERDEITGYIGDVGLIAVAFCTISLAIGYLVPRLLGVAERQAIACSMEIGIHNAALAITIATGVLDSTELAVPAAVYGVVMFPCAAIAGWLITRRAVGAPPTAPAS
ncbi:MAG: bile acid:sodium symporter family protein [Solirubrobacteraceae bacterium]|nr:bile acid:sodium symporter family protein [Solirubrobacteraceae bacterium]